jgi:RimJ/RimL family protein N-acetyltransferase
LRPHGWKKEEGTGIVADQGQGIDHPVLFEFPAEFSSERLTIRMPRIGDGMKVYEAVMASLDDLRPWLPFANDEQSPERSEESIRHAIAEFIKREDLRLLVFLRNTDTMIASSGLHRVDWSVPKFEIGYWIDTRYSGKGYMTEAVKRITQFAFEDLHANRVEIRCDSQNVRSRRIPDRLGFALEGELRDSRRHLQTKQFVSELIFGMTRDKWKSD